MKTIKCTYVREEKTGYIRVCSNCGNPQVCQNEETCLYCSNRYTSILK